MSQTHTITIFALILICLSITFATVDEHINEFEQFKSRFGKIYHSEDHHQKSYKNYKQSREHIEKAQQENPSANYGHTRFSDLSPEEFEQQHLQNDFNMSLKSKEFIKRKPDPLQNFLGAGKQKKIDNSDLPEEFDWISKGVITPAKFQDSCGSCWTFATTGIMESQYAIKYGELLNFSEQMLLDCDNTNQGCRGGLMTDAYQTIKKLGGIQTASDYGNYENKKLQCKFDISKVKAKVVDWYQLSEDEEEIRRELVLKGPIAVGINARKLQYYKSGVIDPPDCDNAINHAVLIVGYGIEDGQKYWLIKNQWGQEWGLNGFFKLVRGKKQCGINTYASIAFVEKV